MKKNTNTKKVIISREINEETNIENYLINAGLQTIVRDFYNDRNKLKFTNIKLSKYIRKKIKPFGHTQLIYNKRRGEIYNLMLSIYRNTDLHKKFVDWFSI